MKTFTNGKIAFIGNSLSAGWDATAWANAFPQLIPGLLQTYTGGQWMRLGWALRSGQTLANTDVAAQAILWASPPDILVHQGGENDVASNEATFKAAYLASIEHALSAGSKLVVACTIWGKYDTNGQKRGWQLDVLQAHREYDNRLVVADIHPLGLVDGNTGYLVSATTGVDSDKVTIATPIAYDIVTPANWYLYIPSQTFAALVTGINEARTELTVASATSAEAAGVAGYVSHKSDWVRDTQYNGGYGNETHPSNPGHAAIAKCVANAILAKLDEELIP